MGKGATEGTWLLFLYMWGAVCSWKSGIPELAGKQQGGGWEAEPRTPGLILGLCHVAVRAAELPCGSHDHHQGTVVEPASSGPFFVCTEKGAALNLCPVAQVPSTLPAAPTLDGGLAPACQCTEPNTT